VLNSPVEVHLTLGALNGEASRFDQSECLGEEDASGLREGIDQAEVIHARPAVSLDLDAFRR
jgi:hypothetical protein